jgi:gluconolactonase
MTETNRRYPDPAVRILDPRFKDLRLASASVECLYQGARWSEGPVWFGDGRYLLWSDIPNNRILRWDEQSGVVTPFRQPSNNANGHTRDREGRLVSCEHLTRRVTRTEYDGSITVLADRYRGKRFNSPNDVVVKSDGSIWFSDPTFGIDGFYEGEQQESELPACVYRVDGQTGEVTVVIDDVLGPNGLAFSPDESILYVVESRGEPRKIRAFDVDGNALSGRCPRQSLVRLGHGHRRTRRRARLHATRRGDRTHCVARALRERLLWRAASQPPVHGGEPWAVLAVCEHAGCEGRVRWLSGCLKVAEPRTCADTRACSTEPETHQLA